MNLLLDTHVWLRSLTAPERIAAETLDLMSDMENQLYIFYSQRLGNRNQISNW